jgi:hypothetical protein
MSKFFCLCGEARYKIEADDIREAAIIAVLRAMREGKALALLMSISTSGYGSADAKCGAVVPIMKNLGLAPRVTKAMLRSVGLGHLDAKGRAWLLGE